MSALDYQVGGSHYTQMKIQPLEYCHANNIGKIEGDVIAYVSRWRSKGGIEDLKKAVHELEILIELEESERIEVQPSVGVRHVLVSGIDTQARDVAHTEPAYRRDIGGAEA